MKSNYFLDGFGTGIYMIDSNKIQKLWLQFVQV